MSQCCPDGKCGKCEMVRRIWDESFQFNEPSEAIKHDTGKPPLSLISRVALLEEARALLHGKSHYGTHNWRKGMEWSRLADAALRHIYAWVDGEDTDSETGLSHLAHARCCLAFLLEYQSYGLGADDRFKREEKK